MYLHIHQVVQMTDGATEERRVDCEIEPPAPDPNWSEMPLEYCVARDVLVKVAPLYQWQVEYHGDPFLGLTARHHKSSHRCSPERQCPDAMTIRAWIDEHAHQSEIAPEQARWWEGQLHDLDLALD